MGKILKELDLKLRWLGLVALMLVCFAQTGWANSENYYYRVNVSASPNVGGKVYASNTTTTSTAGATSQLDGSQRALYSWLFNINTTSVTVNLYATANEGYLFDHWAQGSAAGTSVSTNSTYSPSLTVSSRSSSNRTTFNYYAVFVEQTGLIKVKSADESKGTVGIDPVDNKAGDEVTLTANPDLSNGVKFLGWTKDDGTEYVSTANPYVLTASQETAGTYVAHFSEAHERVFIRMENKATGRFISFYGDKKATAHTRTQEGRTVTDGFIFTSGLKLISASDAQGNPETVFQRIGNAESFGITSGCDFVAHDIQYDDLVGSSNYPLTFQLTNDGSAYYIYTPAFPITYSNNTGYYRSFFCDDGGDYLVMKTTHELDNFDDNTAQWYVYILDADTQVGAWGANTKAKFTKEGKYYTTMFTDFNYQLLDDVKAYYIANDESSIDEEEKMVYFTEITSKMVPANMAVVLECSNVQNDYSSTKTVLNRMIPLAEGTVAAFDHSPLLTGYVSVNGSTEPNSDATLVFSYTSEFGLGFYRYTGSTMPPNRAYLFYSDGGTGATNYSFSFGRNNGDTNKIDGISKQEDDSRVYDLYGRAVSGTLKRGIYVRNGKKFVVK